MVSHKRMALAIVGAMLSIIGLIVCRDVYRIGADPTYQEEMIIPASQVHRYVLQETMGFLSVTRSDHERFPATGYRDVNGEFLEVSDEIHPVAVFHRIWEGGDVRFFPLLRRQGAYREIVTNPTTNDRIWINIGNLPSQGFRGSLDEWDFVETHTQLNPETLINTPAYQAPNLLAEQLTFGKLFQQLPKPPHLFINQFSQGFAEVWNIAGQQLSPLGWLHVQNQGGDMIAPYFLENPPRTPDIDPFFLTTTRVIYETPSGETPKGTIKKEDFQYGGFTICQITHGFMLLCGEDIGTNCDNRPAESYGWIPLRDEQQRLTVWPRIEWRC